LLQWCFHRVDSNLDFLAFSQSFLYSSEWESPFSDDFPLLTDSSYHVWVRSIKLVLILKNKYWFVDGRSGFYLLEILNTRRGNASTIWFNRGSFLRFLRKSLKTWYFLIMLLMFGMNHKNDYRIVFSKRGISVRSSVVDYYTQLMSFWEEMEHYCPLCQCVCRICKAKEFQVEDYMIPFLTGLNDQFSNVHSQILLLELLPTLNMTLSMIRFLLWLILLLVEVVVIPVVEAVAVLQNLHNLSKAWSYNRNMLQEAWLSTLFPILKQEFISSCHITCAESDEVTPCPSPRINIIIQYSWF